MTQTRLVRLNSVWLLQFAPDQVAWRFDTLGDALRWICWETHSANYHHSQQPGEAYDPWRRMQPGSNSR